MQVYLPPITHEKTIKVHRIFCYKPFKDISELVEIFLNSDEIFKLISTQYIINDDREFPTINCFITYEHLRKLTNEEIEKLCSESVALRALSNSSKEKK